MTTAAILITTDKRVHEFVESRKSSILPPDVRTLKDGTKIELSSFFATSIHSDESIKRHIHKTAKDKGGVITLMEDAIFDRIIDLRDVSFSNRISKERLSRSSNNEIQKVVARAVRDYSLLRARAADRKFRKIIFLPIGSFNADAHRDLVGLCRASFDSLNFSADLKRRLEAMQRLQKPRRERDAPSIYYLDGDNVRFEYGHEDHSRPDSASPHDYMCALKNRFRYGVALDPEYHYNVSIAGGSIKGKAFSDCHGADVKHPRSSHLNMFPSGFCT